MATEMDPARPGAAAPGASVYDEDLAAVICARVAGGEGLRRICAEPGLPHRTTLQNWTRAHPQFEAQLRAAQRQARLDARRLDRRKAHDFAFKAPPKRGGQKSRFTEELGERICERLEAGESLTSIGRDPDMPCYGTIMKWVRNNPDFQDRYVEAREIQGDFLFDEARDVAKAATPGTVALARLQFDVIRWQAARLAPRKYVERLVVEDGRADIAAEVAEAAKGPQVKYFVMNFEVGPDGRVLAAPPRSKAEWQDWIESTGEPYAPGVGPNGEKRRPMGVISWPEPVQRR
jgi:hypothetical protein